MTRRRAWVLGAAGIAILCLFAGRFLAELLADRWWAAQFSDGATRAVTRWHLWHLGLGTAGVVLATAWFVLHMLIIVRAVGSVQILRDVGGLQFREVVRPTALKGFALAAGICLGVVTGSAMAGEWRTVLLALHGLEMGIAEPLLQRDAGWYVARLPLWELLHTFALALALLALLSAVMLYAIMGALRLERRRAAINDHARRHLGILLATLALVIAWGFLLRTDVLVAGTPSPDAIASFRRSALVGPALAGTALMVAALSALWALRGRHALLAAGWAVLGVASLVARTGVPLLVSTQSTQLTDAARHALQDSAFGLGSVPAGDSVRLAAAPLLDRTAVAHLFGADAQVHQVSAASVAVGGAERPAWLALVDPAAGPATLVAIAADTTGAGGAALAYRLRDSLAYPTLYPLVSFSEAAARPGAPEAAEVGASRGVASGSLLSRLMLGWAIQSRLPFTAARTDWALHPLARLERLAPFAAWAGARSAVVDGRVLWLADGYVASSRFPLTSSEAWQGGLDRLLRAGFIGVVEPETGATTIYVRPDGGALADAWADIASGVVRPLGDLPGGLLDAAGPPLALAEVQARLLVDRLAETTGTDPLLLTKDGAQPELAWTAAAHPVEVRQVALSGSDHLFAILIMPASGPPRVMLQGASPLGSPSALERMWGRFATLAPIEDSVAGDGGQITAGNVHLWSSPQGLAAMEVLTAVRPGARPAVVWVSVALPDRLGAGRTLSAAWQNLLGNSSPLAPGQGGSTLEEARHWMRIADEALRSGDWGAFGRAFESLRGVLRTGD
jgi:hypothetical protein